MFTYENTYIICKKSNPLAALQPFISEYVFRTIALSEPEPIFKAMPFRVTGSIDFFLGERFDTIDCKSKKLMSFNRCTIRGPRTHKKYTIAISANFVSFTIKFKPTGLYRLLGIPTNLFCNQAIDGQLINTSLFKEITERLINCTNISECVNIIEPYLLKLLQKQAKIHLSMAIDQMTNLIFSNKAPGNITDFLQEVCLSTRQLERNFQKEIGTTPKMYSNMVRFENLLHHKISFPDKTWTSLTYEFNYYDQMHLIKSFRNFLDINPGEFTVGNFAF